MKRVYKKIFKTERDYLFMKKRFQRKILSTFAFSVVASVLMIVHGILIIFRFEMRIVGQRLLLYAPIGLDF